MTGKYRITTRKIFILLLLIFLIPIFLLTSISIGFYKTSLYDIFSVVQHKICEFLGLNNNGQINSRLAAIVWDIRLPRALMALIAGVGLAIAGTTLQGVLRNPLVSPFTIGISSGASFGAALAIVLGIGITGFSVYMVVINAFVFSLIAVSLTLGIARIKGLSQESIILSGIAVMYLFSALVTFLQYIAHEHDLKTLVYWIMGDLAFSNWKRVSIVSPIVIICLVLFKFAWDLNVLAMGDEVAKSSGTEPGTVRLICTVLASLITASIVCMTGPIGFIGLVSPHIARLIIGSDYRYSMFCSALIGALILIAADTAARVITAPTELPVGVLTTFLGVPLFLHLLLRSRREVWR